MEEGSRRMEVGGWKLEVMMYKNSGRVSNAVENSVY